VGKRNIERLALGLLLMFPLLAGLNCGGLGGPQPCTRTCQEILDDLDELSETLFPNDSPPQAGAAALYLCCGGDLLLEAYDCGCEIIGIQTLGTRAEVVEAIRNACETVGNDCGIDGPPDDDEEEPPDDECDVESSPDCGSNDNVPAESICAQFGFSSSVIEEVRQQAEDDLSSGVPYLDALVNASDWCFDRFQADPLRQPGCVTCAGAIVFEVYPTPIFRP
jgi:hypothetical protein